MLYTPRRKNRINHLIVKCIVTRFRSRRPSVFTRVVGRKRTAGERKPYYDEKDKAALRLMRKLRVDWSAGEDSFLLLCKVGEIRCTREGVIMKPPPLV